MALLSARNVDALYILMKINSSRGIQSVDYMLFLIKDSNFGSLLLMAVLVINLDFSYALSNNISLTPK